MTEQTSPRVRILEGEALEVLRGLPDRHFTAVISDPPYGLGEPPPAADVLRQWLETGDYHFARKGGGFMGCEWDKFVPGPALWAEVFRVCKPGAIALIFAAPRTSGWMQVALMLAGFEILDVIPWINGQGMPKCGDMGKMIDKRAGAVREVVGASAYASRRPNGVQGFGIDMPCDAATAPATPEAARWTGWSTTLKPSNEPIIVARRPCAGTAVGNVLEYGCGAMHVDACRVGTESTRRANTVASSYHTGEIGRGGSADHAYQTGSDAGRWPANVLFQHDPECGDECADECPVALLDEQSGERKSGSRPAGVYGERGMEERVYAPANGRAQMAIEANTGGASRFFWAGRHAEGHDLDGFKYAAKAHDTDRNEGLPADIRNPHPTVKPISVARWCARLVGEVQGEILVPFCGSGTEVRAAMLEGFNATGIEREVEFAELSRLRSNLPATEASGWIRLRDRLRAAVVPRPKNGKGRPVRPETPGIPLIKAWGQEGREAVGSWLDATGGDARVAPPPAHMSEWANAFTPPVGHPLPTAHEAQNSPPTPAAPEAQAVAAAETPDPVARLLDLPPIVFNPAPPTEERDDFAHLPPMLLGVRKEIDASA